MNVEGLTRENVASHLQVQIFFHELHVFTSIIALLQQDLEMFSTKNFNNMRYYEAFVTTVNFEDSASNNLNHI